MISADYRKIWTLYTVSSLVLAMGCAVGTEGGASSDGEVVGQVEQGWYSTDPYDQHGRVTYSAASSASGYGISWNCTRKKVYADPFHFIYLYSAYGGQLCDGNVATDDTTSSANHPFFIAMWGAARADSQNHHFSRQGNESFATACSNAVNDLYVGTYRALEWRAAGDNTNFQRAVGVITHAIQDSFAPAHTRRDPADVGTLLDLCSVGEDVAGACRHPESGIPGVPYFPVTEDDADDNPQETAYATQATKEYLIAVARLATGTDPNALAPVIEAWFRCAP